MSKVSDELLPCPFCGSPADPEGWSSIDCKGPACTNPKCNGSADSAEAWNRRSASTPAKAVRVTDEMVEAAARAICWSTIQGYGWRLHFQEEKHRYVDRNWNQYANAARAALTAALSALGDAPQQGIPKSWQSVLKQARDALGRSGDGPYIEIARAVGDPIIDFIEERLDAISHPSTPATGSEHD